MTIHEFISKAGITAQVEAAASNPNWTGDTRHGERHYLVTLSCTHQVEASLLPMAVHFTCGIACDEPTAADVLDCLAMDAHTTESTSDFVEWCSELGFDPDSRKAYKTWEVTRAQSMELEAFLGSELFNELLNDVEAQ